MTETAVVSWTVFAWAIAGLGFGIGLLWNYFERKIKDLNDEIEAKAKEVTKAIEDKEAKIKALNQDMQTLQKCDTETKIAIVKIETNLANISQRQNEILINIKELQKK